MVKRAKATAKAKGKQSTAKKAPIESRPEGRPSSFRPEFVDLAYHLALLGATDKQLADAFGVVEQTVNNWKLAHPEFLESLKRGKDEADAKVAQSLFHRATGYSHPAVKIMTRSLGEGEGSVIEEVPYTEHYPPDTTAAIFWLKNRQRGMWRDRQELDVPGLTTIADAIRAARERASARASDRAKR